VRVPTLEEQYAALSQQQKVLFTALVDKELSDAVLSCVRRLVKVAEHSRNDQAATSASRMLLSLAERRGVFKTDPIDAFMAGVMNYQNGDSPNGQSQAEESPLP
jgi:phosphomevalonate kinase